MENHNQKQWRPAKIPLSFRGRRADCVFANRTLFLKLRRAWPLELGGDPLTNFQTFKQKLEIRRRQGYPGQPRTVKHHPSIPPSPLILFSTVPQIQFPSCTFFSPTAAQKTEEAFAKTSISKVLLPQISPVSSAYSFHAFPAVSVRNSQHLKPSTYNIHTTVCHLISLTNRLQRF